MSIKELARRDGVVAQHDPAGAAQRARRRAIGGRRRPVEARSVQGRDPSAAEARTRSCRASGSASCSSRWAATAARRSSMTTCARSGRCSRRRRGRFSGRSIGRARSASSIVWQPRERGAGRARPDAPRLGRGRVSGLLARRRRRAGLLASRPRICWPGSPAACSGWAALPKTLVWDRQAGIHGHGGRPTRGVRRVLRPAAGRLAVLRAGRSAGQGRGRAAAGLRGDQLRARPRVRQRARLPGPARRLVREGQRAHAQDAARPAGRPARRGARGDGAAARGDARHRPALGHAGPARSAPARRHQRLLARPAPGRPARRGLASTSARSPRSRWTPASSPAGTSAVVRAAPDDHRARARPRAARRPRRAAPRPTVEVRPLARYDALIA